MARAYYQEEAQVINSVATNNSKTNLPVLYFATTNLNKIKEIKRILKGVEIFPCDVKVDEIQSLDPQEVISKKATEAWRKNKYNPVLVEDVSLEISGLGGRPGTFVNQFGGSDIEIRRMIAEVWLKDKDRNALARTIYGIYDGKEVHIWEGLVIGSISEKLSGGNGFGWDDMFIPKKSKKTFAEMTDKEKDTFSMRKIALEKLKKDLPKLKLSQQILMLPEPYKNELERVQIKKLQNKKAIDYAYKLECLETNNKPKYSLTAEKYNEITRTENIYFSRYWQKPSSHSIGLICTDVDRDHIKTYKNGDPVLWQMGPERRHLALAQRVEYFLQNQNDNVLKTLQNMEKMTSAERENYCRHNKTSPAIEHALGTDEFANPVNTISLKEIGYKKISATKNVSRERIAESGLFTFIGKYPRSIYAVGCLPAISGWRDIVVMSALGHMPVFVHRNNVNTIDLKEQIKLIEDCIKIINSLQISPAAKKMALRNIGAAIGCNPKKDLDQVRKLFKLGIKLFRIYTINSDPRVIETARALRKEFGEKIEIFVGQIADLKQAEGLIANDIKVDALIFGHGGGRQCTSATNGMALTTLEEVYSVLKDARFNNTTIMVEGGISTNVGGLLVAGVDGILRNAQFANCVIEQGDLYFEHKYGGYCLPYHGSASPATFIIEASNPENIDSRLWYSGRTKKVEGKTGYIFYKEKANSMAFYVDEFKHYAARTLADLGVMNISELRQFTKSNPEDLLRIVSQDASHTSKAYKSR